MSTTITNLFFMESVKNGHPGILYGFLEVWELQSHIFVSQTLSNLSSNYGNVFLVFLAILGQHSVYSVVKKLENV
jgi:hypothetical protein